MTRWLLRASSRLALSLLVCAVSGCGGSETQAANTTPPAPIVATRAADPPAVSTSTRDLSVDESMGGHTLSRHVGRTDAQLRERLRREPQISAASTYTDRATAEETVGAALAAGGRKLDTWRERAGRRPNLVLDYAGTETRTIGRSLERDTRTPVDCTRAVVVLRWDERRDRFYVLTSYPEASQ